MKCTMYDDPANCHKAPCGSHCQVYADMHKSPWCPDDDGTCKNTGEMLCGGMTCYVCSVRNTLRDSCDSCGRFFTDGTVTRDKTIKSHCTDCADEVCIIVLRNGVCAGGDCDGCPDDDPCVVCKRMGRTCIISPDHDGTTDCLAGRC